MGLIEDEVSRLQGKMAQLDARIKSLEEKQFGGPAKTTEEIRMILIGPPGAGMSTRFVIERRRFAKTPTKANQLAVLQARALKLPRSRRSSAVAIW